ncbi:MAG: Gldg family protein [Sulfolobales archaeon]
MKLILQTIKIKKLQYLLGSLIGCIAFFIIIGSINFLAYKWFLRIEISARPTYKLSKVTLETLSRLTNELNVIILFDKRNPMYELVSGLIKEYTYVSPYLKVKYVDYTRNPGEAEQLAVKFSLPRSDADVVVFEYSGKHKVVYGSSLSEYNIGEWLAGKSREIKRTAFKGEMLFTSAIGSLLANRQSVVYFLEGHGEHSPNDNSRIFGYSTFSQLLESKNLTVKKLILATTAEIPPDCSLLVIAGPKGVFTPLEIQKIESYLNKGGRGLFLLSFYQSGRRNIGLEELLTKWRIHIGSNFVFDQDNTIQGTDIVCTNFSSHPIMHPLQGRAIYLVYPRSVMPINVPLKTGDDPKVDFLIATSTNGFTASRFNEDGVPMIDPLKDIKGVISLAIAAEKNVLPGLNADRTTSRIVVIGESILFGNESIRKLSNWEFASSIIDWLMYDPDNLTPIAPKPIQEFRVLVTTSQLKKAAFMLLFIVPASTLIIGILVWLRRHY